MAIGIPIGVLQQSKTNPIAADYRSRLIANGDTITDAEVALHSNFVNKLEEIGARSKSNPDSSAVLDCCTFFGNNLNGSATKLFTHSTAAKNVNIEQLVAADYSKAIGISWGGGTGGTGSWLGGTKAINLNINPFLHWSDDQKGILGYYAKSGVDAQIIDIGVNIPASPSRMLFHISGWGGHYWDCYSVDNARISVSPAPAVAGFYLGIRDGANQFVQRDGATFVTSTTISSTEVRPNANLLINPPRPVAMYLAGGGGVSEAIATEISNAATALMQGLGR